ncbi:MAG TPA: choice-of-anchor tandem repeat GloVer-containing protein, partial [Verrucomicrobiae bacterium]|nr:choice-of-anchor tandem repeat GloVer-containing protein [Verrucomicrobiae bacterium]
MKNHIRSFFITLGIWAGIYQACSAATFTITPSAISNTYSGTITLQIGGLTDGQTVTVQKFLDTDRSNVVDSSALLVQQFQLTDGQASVFTNGATTVTNFYVPGDTDGAANGSITAALYPGIDFQQEYVGTYLFVLYAGGTPVTNSLVVTNFLFAQTIKGNVVSNSTATTLPYSVVTIVKGIGNNVTPIAGIVASNNGAFSITVPPGTYSVFGYKNGYVAPFANAPTVTLGAGSTITTNVSLTRATNTISGQVVDATSNAGLGGLGIFVQAYDRSAFAFAFTDTNGNYTASVTPYQWQINPNGQSLVLKGYNQPNNNTEVDTTGGSVSDVMVPFQKGTALFYGKVTDPSGNPLSGVAIASSDSDNNYYTDGYSYTNGQYTTVAVGGLNNDSWQIQYDGTGPANYIYAQPSLDQNGGTNFNVGQAVKINFTGLLATNIITGHIQDSNSNSIAGLGVNATATINGSVYSSSADTDTNGNYSLNVSVADWSVNINCGDGGDGLQDLYPEGNFECPNGQFININSPTGILNFVVQLAGGRIFGHVLDYNGNPVAGIGVNANDGVGDNDSTTTDGTGYYSLSVGNGNWDVSVDCGQLNALGYDCVSDDNAYISDGNAEANFSAQLSTSSTSVYPFQTLYGFSATSANANGLSTNSDGSSPSGGLVLLGNILYGGTQNGGTNGSGTIFAISTTLTNLVVEHTFSAPNTNNQDVLTNSDGGVPSGTLVISSNILYGTATYGGVFGYGTVFKLATNGASFNTLRSF